MTGSAEADYATHDCWLQRLRSDEPVRGAAIEELGHLLRRGLNRSLSSRYGVSVQIDDVVQDALLKILDSLDQFEGRSRFMTWAMTIATRIGISALRRQYKREVSIDAFDSEENLRMELPDEGSASVGDMMERREILEQLQALIESDLTSRQRLAIRTMLEGIPVDETAYRMGSNRNAVYKLVHDARLKLKRGLERQGYSVEHVRSIFSNRS